MRILLPQLSHGDWRAHARAVASQSALPPFDPQVVNFINAISQAIAQDRSLRSYPELMAVAHWLRRANIVKLQQATEERHKHSIRLPRGTVLHFAPSNVDTIFIYSWLLALLAGNANIVRLSSQLGTQVTALLRILAPLLERDEYSAIRDRTLLLTYMHDAEISTALSQACQVRVIWGGDETIGRIRAIPLNPVATEVVFADRFSFAALNSEAVLAAADAEFNQLINNFYNDAFLFAQMACSSPRLIAWVGSPKEISAARQRFWTALENDLLQREYALPAAAGIRRMATAYAYAAEMENTQLSGSHRLTCVKLPQFSPGLRERHCGGGLFIEMAFAALPEMAPALTQKDQTLAVFGFQHADLIQFVQQLPNRAIDRIVPIGQALVFSAVWDGYNLIDSFTRELSVTVT